MDNSLSKTDRTRQLIIEAAAPIFNKKGFSGTAMSDLTAATGLTKGSIYGNFVNKEEVAIAAFDHNYRKIHDHTQRQIEKAQTYFDKIMAYVRVYDQYMRSYFPEGGCPIQNTAIEADDTNDALKQRAAKAILRWKDDIAGLLRSGIKAGELKDEVDPEQLAFSLIALIEGGIMIARVTGQKPNLDKVLLTAEHLLTRLKR